VQEGKPDRIADLLEEAADALEKRAWVGLTEDDSIIILMTTLGLPEGCMTTHNALNICKAIEDKLKEKNT
jgi:acyl-CoA synthetase (AMP-forming)/AMP-acid ligase II